ncbi:helix-turn-helix domain-containing protein [Alkaliphilus sp. B6464]|uniref:helix-turn-helix domain-containing protein n=1 Tax=Alkaliphilus sp. B6464 TaxID=2731219 RepID=UPI001BAC525A|nr:helix-turn-helix transcriptional regulator [Alkaliphilus sp. B6464]QUH21728.1 helix-turn-helix transcriptional regulator [Alkaliphilus sp. B6464]
MQTDNKKIIGANIKKARKSKSMTQLEVAEKINISRNYLSDLENGRYAPSSEKLLLLAKCLELDVNKILKQIEM